MADSEEAAEWHPWEGKMTLWLCAARKSVSEFIFSPGRVGGSDKCPAAREGGSLLFMPTSSLVANLVTEPHGYASCFAPPPRMLHDCARISFSFFLSKDQRRCVCVCVKIIPFDIANVEKIFPPSFPNTSEEGSTTAPPHPSACLQPTFATFLRFLASLFKNACCR